MRYELIDGYPRLIRYVRRGGQVISNPTDEMLDAWGCGKKLMEEPLPAVDPFSQYVKVSYRETAKRIYPIYEAAALSGEET